MCYNRDSLLLKPAGNLGGKIMKRHIRLDALLSASVLSLMATAGWSQTLIWLGTLGGNSSTAYDVSDNGVVVGQAANAAGQERAFRWQNGVMTDLGTLGGANSGAYAVTPDGRIVVGYAQNRQGQYRAFRWILGVGMADLGTLGGTTGSSAYAVSDNGNTVVGGSDVSPGRPVIKPFIWESNRMTQVNIGDLFTYALGVSGLGDLVAISSLSDAFLRGKHLYGTANRTLRFSYLTYLEQWNHRHMLSLIVVLL
jgi:probable HAF family extracellular repeat protein